MQYLLFEKHATILAIYEPKINFYDNDIRLRNTQALMFNFKVTLTKNAFHMVFQQVIIKVLYHSQE